MCRVGLHADNLCAAFKVHGMIPACDDGDGCKPCCQCLLHLLKWMRDNKLIDLILAEPADVLGHEAHHEVVVFDLHMHGV